METIEAILRHVLERRGEVVLPTSLLVDSRGFLQMIYLGPVGADRLLADARKFAFIRDVAPSRRSLFPGRWYFRTPRDLSGLADDLKSRGQRYDARFYYAVGQLRKQPKSE